MNSPMFITNEERGLAVATSFALKDERVYWFEERWERHAELGDRRVQRAWVVRGDTLARYDQDMGPWDWENDRPSQAPSFWEYSLAECREITDIGRGRKIPQDDEPIDLVAVWAKDLDERRMQAEHHSISGSLFRKERN